MSIREFVSWASLCTVAFTLLVPSAALGQGGMTSNGGDPLRFLFEEGKKHAIDLVSKLHKHSLNNLVDDFAAREWISQNQAALQADLAKSVLDWDTLPPKDTCAATTRSPVAAINLSFARCRSISTKEEAGKLLIHEAVHHFGISDESFADRVAMGIYSAWQKLQLIAVPLCESRKPNIIANHLVGSWTLHKAISAQLGSPVKVFALTFTRDESVLKNLPGFGRCAYLAGVATISGIGKEGRPETISHPYVLSEFHGSTFVKLFEPGAEDEFKAHLIVMLARAAEEKNTVLLMGGDNDNQPLTALSRVCNATSSCKNFPNDMDRSGRRSLSEPEITR